MVQSSTIYSIYATICLSFISNLIIYTLTEQNFYKPTIIFLFV